MTEIRIADKDASLEAVLIRRQEFARQTYPDIKLVDKVVLKDGPRAYKVATHWVIVDRNTGEVHHDALKIDTFRKRKDGWILDLGHSITIEADESDALQKLSTFLASLRMGGLPERPGSYLVIPIRESQIDPASVQQLLNEVSTGSKADLLAKALEAISDDPGILEELLDRTPIDAEATRSAATALNLVAFSEAVTKLEDLIKKDAREQEFQTLLEEHPWMFGSEYSELLDERKYTRNEQQDFVLRRTVDDFLEIIEIKTPLKGKALFLEDKSHETVFPSRALAEAIGQVMHYLELLDADRYTILAKDKLDTNKARAKIIIGCLDGDEQQAVALRNLNGHLHRIEVLTFDQLLRMAKQVLSILRTSLDTDE
jgi:hypothetical protein